MIKIFDYIYYRLNKFYFKWDGKNGSTAVIGLSMLQSMLIGNLFLFFLMCFFEKSFIENYKSSVVSFVLIIFGFFVIFNFIKYKNKFEYLNKYWQNETIAQRRLRGIFVISSLIFPWIVLFSIGLVNSTR